MQENVHLLLYLTPIFVRYICFCIIATDLFWCDAEFSCEDDGGLSFSY